MRVHVIETENTVVLVCSNIVSGITGQILANLLQSADQPVLPSVPSRDAERYKVFRDRFGLEDNSSTWQGYQRLSETAISKEQIQSWSLRESLSNMTSWLDPCLLTGDELIRSLLFLGAVDLTRLEKIVSQTSGLPLKWDKYKLFRLWFGLEDDDRTRAAFNRLNETNVSAVPLSTRACKALLNMDGEKEKPKILLDVCLCRKDHLLQLRNFGKACFERLQQVADETSGLHLEWPSSHPL